MAAKVAMSVKQQKVSKAKSDTAARRHTQAGHASADVPSTEAEPKPANGSYEFLVDHFASPSTIIGAATILHQDTGIDANVAVKKVEAFLENAKLDQTLEVRAGTGSNEGQYLIARVPQCAQKMTGDSKMRSVRTTSKTKTPKVAEKEKEKGKSKSQSAGELTFRSLVRATAFQVFVSGYHSVAHVVAQVVDTTHEPIKRARSATTSVIDAAWIGKHGYVVHRREGKDGHTEYHLVRA